MQNTHEYRITVMEDLDKQVNQVLTNDYLKTVKFLTGTEITCMRTATVLAIGSSIFTGLGSVLAFSAGFFRNEYLSYASGCSSVIAIILVKASYYANSQSHYHDAKLKNLLTKEYQMLDDFVKDPRSLPPVEEPEMPDPSSSKETGTS